MLTDELIRERDTLAKEITELEAKRKRLVLIIELLKTYGEADGQPQLITVPQNGAKGPFSGKPFTYSVRGVLNRNAHRFLTCREISDAMTEGGYRTTSPHLTTMVAASCNRWSVGEDAMLERAKKGAFFAYRLKP